MNKPLQLWLFVFLFASSAWSLDFPECGPNTPKRPLDDFCPKIEGQPLARCCPVKSIKRTCVFHREGSISTSDEGTAGGWCAESPVVSCCNSGSIRCQTESNVSEQDRPVVFRGNGCCVLPCQEPAGGGWSPGTIETCESASGNANSCEGPACSSIPNNCPVPTPFPTRPPPEPNEPEPTTEPQPTSPPTPPTPGGNG